jgi:murein DD-endopeptidase MepM/ murein hydrolase activator NlpD
LEFVVLGIAILAVVANYSLNHHANLVSSSDQSVIFSFLKNNPRLNDALIASSDTTTILAKSDQLISKAFASSGILLASSNSASTGSQSVDPTTIQDDVILKTNPADTQNFYRHGLTTYKVQSGDTLGGIASSFGISPQTILMENKIDEGAALKLGQELTILPTTGITYTLKNGDTLESILKKYKASEDDFLDANNIESFEDLDVGAVVVIPMSSVTLPAKPKPASTFVKSDSGKVALRTASAPADLAAGVISFVWPTPVRTITQGFSSRHTGVDISNSKMEAIYAAADGFVEISGYQTNGYGNTIVINHGSSYKTRYKTRYGHASELYVSAGEYVKKGQLIAKQGRTGRVRGATGIHLHFEILKNGKRVNPLSYVHP